MHEGMGWKRSEEGRGVVVSSHPRGYDGRRSREGVQRDEPEGSVRTSLAADVHRIDGAMRLP